MATSYKSPSGSRFKRAQARRESGEILVTRRAKAKERATGLSVKEYVEVSGKGYESAGHYHWRLLHKNLAKPILRTRRVKIISLGIYAD